MIVTHPITFGAVLAARKLGLRWASSVWRPYPFYPHTIRRCWLPLRG